MLIKPSFPGLFFNDMSQNNIYKTNSVRVLKLNFQNWIDLDVCL